MYVTEANITSKLGRSLTADESSYFLSVLSPSIDAYINEATGTSFGSTTVVNVYVEGDDGNYLVIPTMHDITALARVDTDGSEEAIPVDDYRTYPFHADNKLAIKHLNGEWDSDVEYKITGQMGYKTVPADITAIATELAVNQINSTYNNYKSEKVGDWSVTYADNAQFLSSASIGMLDRYKRLSRGI